MLCSIGVGAVACGSDSDKPENSAGAGGAPTGTAGMGGTTGGAGVAGTGGGAGRGGSGPGGSGPGGSGPGGSGPGGNGGTASAHVQFVLKEVH